MALTPLLNHWWHVTLRVSARGVTTGPMPCEAGLAEIELDLVAHRAVVRTSEGAARLRAARRARGRRVLRAPVRGPGRPRRELRHPADALRPRRRHGVPRGPGAPLYDADAVAAGAVLRSAADAFGEFSGRFSGKTSPVQLFWHSFDLAVTRFSGRRAPPSQGADPVTAEAYTHEVVSFGFWAGDDRIPMPAFYSYTAPEPPSLVEQPSHRRRPRGRRGRPARWPCCRTRTSARPWTCARR